MMSQVYMVLLPGVSWCGVNTLSSFTALTLSRATAILIRILYCKWNNKRGRLNQYMNTPCYFTCHRDKKCQWIWQLHAILKRYVKKSNNIEHKTHQKKEELTYQQEIWLKLDVRHHISEKLPVNKLNFKQIIFTLRQNVRFKSTFKITIRRYCNLCRQHFDLKTVADVSVCCTLCVFNKHIAACIKSSKSIRSNKTYVVAFLALECHNKKQN